MRSSLSGLAFSILIGGCAVGTSVADPSLASPAPSAPPSIVEASPSPATDPEWSTALADQLDCDGPVSSLGAGADPTEVSGVPLAASAAEALPAFLEGEATFYGFLPLDGWEVLESTDEWVLAGHVADGGRRALATFHDGGPDAPDPPLRWSVWQVAACDPSEFAADVPISIGLTRWTDVSGEFVPTTTVREADLCAPMRRLRVDGREFVRDPDGRFGPDRLVGTFAADVELPADATDTPYRDGERRLWIAADVNAAYVGTVDSLERWPRAVDDDATVIDCN
jgi:hypothetical protein